MSKSCSGKINKTRYDDLGKPMKQTSFILKNLGGNLPEKQSIIEKRSFRSSTKPLSLDSTIPVDELTAETFYRFRTSELFNIRTPPFFCPLKIFIIYFLKFVHGDLSFENFFRRFFLLKICSRRLKCRRFIP